MKTHETLHNLVQSLEQSPANGLEQRIVLRIEQYRRRVRLVQTWTYGTLAVLSVGAMVPAVMSLLSSLSQSGFYQYVSLAFSDGGTVWTLGKDFAYLVAESLPLTTIALSLALVAVLIWSAGKIINRTPLHAKNYGTA